MQHVVDLPSATAFATFAAERPGSPRPPSQSPVPLERGVWIRDDPRNPDCIVVEVWGAAGRFLSAALVEREAYALSKGAWFQWLDLVDAPLKLLTGV